MAQATSDGARHNGTDTGSIAVSDLDETQARAELARLAGLIERADIAYHREDDPEIPDAEYDALKQRTTAIESRFPRHKRADSPRALRWVRQSPARNAHAVAVQRFRGWRYRGFR